ncbi:1-acyl-sn-glycerol-3-phosphate acyltransferase [Sphingobium sp. SCG-1]|uniref:lysophospholipid acyltransferase family protein n=1 Tax=Sphingobium sp. SCG-1 TaxID=2072936 RepID=UPI000CD6C4F8|nr:lysophospholipid acyltransferase family protein [Sphingobium sp. SCG-1]AUW57536.1 1-acyl-sn-glycerol-3-phosphate acyltransferase [Sphingobium sp. SCG-1]
MIMIRSLAFMAVFYGLSLFWVLWTIAAAPFGTRHVQIAATRWSRFHRRCARVLLGQKVEVVGTLPSEPMLYVLKHESMFEAIDLLCLFDAPMVAAKKELIEIPLWGHAARLYGLIPVERTAGPAAMRALRKAALDGLATGRPICLFPEGTRVPHGTSPELRAGFAGLYMLLKVPVVPIAVNSGRVSPRRTWLKRPGTITYLVGETIPAGLPRAEAEARAHAAINALN